MNINLDANSLGGRIVGALVVLSLCLQVVGDEIGCRPRPEPMTIETCQSVCGDRDIKRLEGWVCECADRMPIR